MCANLDRRRYVLKSKLFPKELLPKEPVQQSASRPPLAETAGPQPNRSSKDNQGTLASSEAQPQQEGSDGSEPLPELLKSRPDPAPTTPGPHSASSPVPGGQRPEQNGAAGTDNGHSTGGPEKGSPHEGTVEIEAEEDPPSEPGSLEDDDIDASEDDEDDSEADDDEGA